MMKGFKELGVAMTGVFPVSEAIELTKVAEKSGLGSAWFAEDYFFRGGIPYMAAAAMATEKIRLGLSTSSINCYGVCHSRRDVKHEDCIRSGFWSTLLDGPNGDLRQETTFQN
jgi:hypothetical protein